MNESVNNEKLFCTFTIDHMLFGIDVDEVREVVKSRDITIVPLATQDISGLVNLRGEIVTTISLRQRLGLQDVKREDDDFFTTIVVQDSEGVESFVVDEIRDVVSVDEQEYEPPPSSLDGPVKDKVKGVYQMEEQLLLVLDVAKAIDIDAYIGQLEKIA